MSVILGRINNSRRSVATTTHYVLQLQTISHTSYILLSIFTAGLGMFAGANFPLGKQIGRVGDAAFPTVDHDWHNSPMSGASASKHEADYHWPLTNYDWNAPDIGMENEAEDVSVTVTGFGGTLFCFY